MNCISVQGWRHFSSCLGSRSKSNRELHFTANARSNEQFLASTLTDNGSASSKKISVIDNAIPNSNDAVKRRYSLTEKDYFQSIRNRLFAVEEQLWLHRYAVAHQPCPVVDPLPHDTVNLLLTQKEAMLQELPLSSLTSYKRLADQQNLTHAARGLKRRIDDLQRQMHLPQEHINQIAVSSFQGQVLHLMRGHGTLVHRLLSNEEDDNVEMRIVKSNMKNRSLRRQFQHVTFSHDHRYCGSIESVYPVLSDLDILESDIENGNESHEDQQHADNHEKSIHNQLYPLPIHCAVLVHEVENSPKRFGDYESRPYFDSGMLPSAPFHVQFSPDNRQLIFLCSPYNKEASNSNVSLVVLNWQKHLILPPTKDTKGRIVDAHIAGATAETLLEGESIYFTFTTSSPTNASIVVHVYYSGNNNDLIEDSEVVSETSEVWILTSRSVENSLHVGDDEEDNEFMWTKISSEPYISNKVNATKWFTPQCHSAGGGDNIVLVEEGYLVTKALSRWKRTFPTLHFENTGEDIPNGLDSLAFPAIKRLLPVTGGHVHFLVSPDHSKMAVLEEKIASDGDGVSSRLLVIEGEDILDPLNPATVTADDGDTPFHSLEQGNSKPDRVVNIPIEERVVAFWFSPDSTQLLLFSHAQEDDLSSGEEECIRLTASVYNFPMKQFRELETFKPTSYFVKTYVAHFTQYAQTYNPWSPDSKSFLYITNAGLNHVPIVESKYSTGMGSWSNQGASFATWSRA